MKTIVAIFSLFPLIVFGGVSTGPNGASSLTPAQLAAAGVVTVASNTIVVSSSRQTFTNLWMASTNAANGDTITVGPGTYQEGNHACTFPKNITVIPNGSPTFYVALSNSVSGFAETNIYIRPTDNMVIRQGMKFICQTTNKFNAIFGATPLTPDATNWQVSLDYDLADSDGIYFANTTNMMIGNVKGGIIDSKIIGYWDEFATANTRRTNLSIVMVNCVFSSDSTNQSIATSKRPVNIASDGQFTLNNCTFISTKQFGGGNNYGLNVGSQLPVVSVNNCLFDVTSANGSYDVYNVATTTNTILNAGCARRDGTAVTYDPAQSPFGAASTTVGALIVPYYDLDDGAGLGTWSLSTASDISGVLRLIQAGNSVQGANFTNSWTPDGVYHATGFGIYGGPDGFTGIVTNKGTGVVTNRIYWSGGIVTNVTYP